MIKLLNFFVFDSQCTYVIILFLEWIQLLLDIKLIVTLNLFLTSFFLNLLLEKIFCFSSCCFVLSVEFLTEIIGEKNRREFVEYFLICFEFQFKPITYFYFFKDQNLYLFVYQVRQSMQKTTNRNNRGK